MKNQNEVDLSRILSQEVQDGLCSSIKKIIEEYLAEKGFTPDILMKTHINNSPFTYKLILSHAISLEAFKYKLKGEFSYNEPRLDSSNNYATRKKTYDFHCTINSDNSITDFKAEFYQ